MLDIKEIRLFFLRNGYLLIIAAWLFTFAFLFNNYWSYYSSPHGVQRSLENDIHSRQEDFRELTADTAVVNSLFRGDYSRETLEETYSESYHVFAYDSSDAGTRLRFWSTNTVEPPAPNTSTPPTTFRKMANGWYVVLTHRPAPDRWLIGLLPVKEEFAINNDYLGSSFYGRPAIGPEYTIQSKPPGLPVVDADKGILFTSITTPPNQTPRPAWRACCC
ncbi:hypothetical protein WJU16_21045 [Chitinophaga pollutisoli]|uniref:Uncharacterized protein n=1 Tax=Chitinophaga pollutisoli TaxID=3133966 RepID=A0ABZ2YM34_9BACT